MNTLRLNLLWLALFFLIHPADLLSSNQDSIIYENDSVFTIETYKDELSSDGEWIKIDKDQLDPNGVSGEENEVDGDINTEWVWRPFNMDPDWTPYSNGYWVYTDCGWMWISYYHWGWRTCHFGRWWWSPIWGWVWSPGFVWAPAWVVWMYYGDYCGWYPISPRIRWRRHHGWHCHHMRFHVRHWTFCNTNNFNVHINHEVIVDPPGNKKIIDQATFVSDINIVDKKVVNKGPDKKVIEKATGKKIEVKDVKKFNNVKDIISDDKDMKQGEKKIYNDNNGKKSYDNGSKNTDTPKKNEGGKNTDTPKKNDGGKNTDTPRKNEGNKNNDVKKESKSPPKQYSPPPQEKKQDPPKSNDSYNKGNDNQNITPPPPPVKKQDQPPPPSDNSKTEDIGTDSKQK